MKKSKVRSKVFIKDNQGVINIIKKDNTEVNYFFDKEFFDLVSQYNWYSNYYNYCVSETTGSLIFLHRLLTGVQNDLEVDHIDLNTFNNHLSNLRICSRSLNNVNHKIRKNTISCAKGIEKCNDKYRAILKYNKEKYSSLLFNTIDEAIYARCLMEKWIIKDVITDTNDYNISEIQKQDVTLKMAERLKGRVDLSD